jgi:hypothetical protein
MSFKPVQPKFSFGRSSGGFGSAAGMVDVAGAFQAQRRNAPKFDDLYATGIANRSNERSGIMEAKAAIIGKGMAADAAVESAQLLADARVASANSQVDAAGQGAAMKGLGSIIGAGLTLFSDRDTKDNIERIEDALTQLRQLKPVTFNYKPEYSTSPERLHYGFIAQEYKEVMPDATYYDESTKKLCIDPVELIGLLVRSVQQLETRVQYLEATKALAEVK